MQQDERSQVLTTTGLIISVSSNAVSIATRLKTVTLNEILALNRAGYTHAFNEN